jgi:hypothetical protein
VAAIWELVSLILLSYAYLKKEELSKIADLSGHGAMAVDQQLLPIQKYNFASGLENMLFSYRLSEFPGAGQNRVITAMIL